MTQLQVRFPSQSYRLSRGFGQREAISCCAGTPCLLARPAIMRCQKDAPQQDLAVKLPGPKRDPVPGTVSHLSSQRRSEACEHG